MSDGALNAHLDWLDECYESQKEEPRMRIPKREDFAHFEKKRHRARTSDPLSSHAAAAGIRDEAGEYHFAIWLKLRLAGHLTSEELLEALGKKASSPGGTRTRIRRLEKEGWIRYTGEKRRTKRGSFARVMRAAIPADFYDPPVTTQGELFDER